MPTIFEEKHTVINILDEKLIIQAHMSELLDVIKNFLLDRTINAFT